MPRLTSLGSNLGKLSNRLQPLQAGWRAPNAGSTKRGYGYAWQKLRVAFLQQHPLCVMCMADGRTTSASVVDHIVPHEGDHAKFWDQGNLQSLCAHCHSSAKQRAERATPGGHATTFPRPDLDRCANSRADSASDSKGIKWPA